MCKALFIYTNKKICRGTRSSSCRRRAPYGRSSRNSDRRFLVNHLWRRMGRQRGTNGLQNVDTISIRQVMDSKTKQNIEELCIRLFNESWKRDEFLSMQLVCLLVFFSVINLNLCHNFWILRDGNILFCTHTTSLVHSNKVLWPRQWPVCWISFLILCFHGT